MWTSVCGQGPIVARRLRKQRRRPRVEPPVKIAALSGSLQAASANTALLQAAPALVPGVDVVLFESLAEVPAMNPDVDDAHAAEPVKELRGLIAAADAV